MYINQFGLRKHLQMSSLFKYSALCQQEQGVSSYTGSENNSLKGGRNDVKCWGKRDLRGVSEAYSE